MAAIARGDHPPVVPAELDYDQQEVLVFAALGDHLALVLELYGPEFHGVLGGSPDVTVIHHAAWVGSPELVGALLDAGADPSAGEWSALRSAVAGSVYHDIPGRDYVGVAERLVAAGNVIEPAFLDEADGPLAA